MNSVTLSELQYRIALFALLAGNALHRIMQFATTLRSNDGTEFDLIQLHGGSARLIVKLIGNLPNLVIVRSILSNRVLTSVGAQFQIILFRFFPFAGFKMLLLR